MITAPAFQINDMDRITMLQYIIARHAEDMGVREQLLRRLIDVYGIDTGHSLKLAVIGHFSAGKTSLINAIIRRKLLPAKNEVTTHVPTIVRSGDRLSLTIEFDNGHRIDASESDLRELSGFISMFYKGNHPKTEALDAYIELVMLNPAISGMLTSIEISIPIASGLFENILWIDTPGLFAGVEHASGHEESAKAAIDQADVLLVVLPAERAISRSLMDFLRKLTPAQLGSCFFLISRMDMATSEAKKKDLEQFVRDQLKTQLALSDITVFTCSCIAMLPDAERILGNAAEEWKTDFVAFESRLAATLKQMEPSIRSERRRHILSSLKDRIYSLLNERHLRYSSQKLTLEQSPPLAVGPLKLSMLKHTDDEVKACWKRVMTLLQIGMKSLKEKLERSASAKVYDAKSGIYESYSWITTDLNRELTDELETLIRTLDIELCKAENSLSDVVNHIRHTLLQAYPQFSNFKVSATAWSIRQKDLKFPVGNYSPYIKIVESENEHSNRVKGFFVKIARSLSLTDIGPLQQRLISSLNDSIVNVHTHSYDMLQNLLDQVFNSYSNNIQNGINQYFSVNADQIVQAEEIWWSTMKFLYLSLSTISSDKSALESIFMSPTKLI